MRCARRAGGCRGAGHGSGTAGPQSQMLAQEHPQPQEALWWFSRRLWKLGFDQAFEAAPVPHADAAAADGDARAGPLL